MADLRVYIDFKSPFAYLAVEPTRSLAAELGITVDWLPFVVDIPSYLGSARLDKEGKVVEQGVKDDILNPPFPEYTELLLSSVPTMDPGWLSGAVEARRAMDLADQVGEA